MIRISHTGSSKKFVKEYEEKYIKRVEEGLNLLSIKALEFILEEVRDLAPTVDGYDYSKDLVIANVSDDESAMSIVLKYNKTESKKMDPKKKLIWIYPKNGAKESVQVIARYSPWPIGLIPIEIDAKSSLMISRSVSSGEVSNETRRLKKIEKKIVNEVNQTDGSIKKLKGVAVSGAYNDISFIVMRKEFGVNEKHEPHWRPAIKSTSNKMKSLAKMYAEYIRTGNPNAFDIQQVSGVSLVKMKSGKWFYDKLGL